MALAPPTAVELLASLPVAVLVVDPEDRIVHVNHQAEQLLNRSERQVRGQHCAEAIGRASSTDRQAYAIYDVPVETADGVRRHIDLAEVALADHPGWRIVTLHPTGRTLGLERGERQGARAAIGAAAMLAHEIKNPLSGIRGAAQLLGSGALTTLIVAEVDRIAALIDRMEAFGDDRPLAVGSANIYPIIAHARTLVAAGPAAGCRIEERFDPSLPPALVDRDALVQILLNLLKNAAEACAAVPDPRIVIATAYRHGVARLPDGQSPRPLPIEITIADNGPGPPAAIADHLFEPFVTGKPDGRGLGLPLVDKLVGDMGGMIQYTREADAPMTIFRLLLPRAPA